MSSGGPTGLLSAVVTPKPASPFGAVLHCSSVSCYGHGDSMGLNPRHRTPLPRRAPPSVPRPASTTAARVISSKSPSLLISRRELGLAAALLQHRGGSGSEQPSQSCGVCRRCAALRRVTVSPRWLQHPRPRSGSGRAEQSRARSWSVATADGIVSGAKITRPLLKTRRSTASGCTDSLRDVPCPSSQPDRAESPS